MKRTAAVVVAALLVVGTLAGLPLAGLAQSDAGGNDAVEPGERLAGVVGVEEAEFAGEMERRTFDARLSRANSSAAKAAVIAQQVEHSETRLEELRARQERLREAHENGSISEGEYRARMARLVAEIRTVERVADRTQGASRSIPNETLRERGINVTAIRTLQENARNMTGPEVSAVARSIAGPDAGRGEPGRPDGVGASDRANRSGNASQRGPPEDASDDGGANVSNPSDSGAGDGERGPSANRSDKSGQRNDSRQGGSSGQSSGDSGQSDGDSGQGGDGSDRAADGRDS